MSLAAPLFAAQQRIERVRRIGVTVGRVYLGLETNQVLQRGRILGLLSGLARRLDAGVDPMLIVLPYIVGSQAR